MRCVHFLSADSNCRQASVLYPIKFQYPVSYNRYHVCWLSVQPVGKLLVVRDEVGNIDVAVVLLNEHILADLISAFRQKLQSCL